MTNTLTPLVLLLIMGSSILSSAGTDVPVCFHEGNMATYQCQVPAVSGTLDWQGIGFYCPNKTTAANNTIALQVSSFVCSAPFTVYNGMCGPYSANLTCAGDDVGKILSVLEFQANYEMNGGNIYCLFHGDNTTFHISVGVTPNPPLRVRVMTRQDGCRFDWTPPNESIGGIGGYNISYGENCGNCSPAAGFVNKTEELTAECSECIGENNNICHFEVSTVSEDCSFYSPPVEATSDSPINSPMDITVSITCSLTPNPPPIYVEWIWQFSEESRREFSGFLITISDQFGHKVEDIQEDSKVRSKYFDSFVLKERDGFVGEIWNATVAIAFDEDRDTFAFDSIQFSVEDTIMIDPSSAVTPSQCIEVSINSHCDERSETFQAQVQFIEGSCESDSELTNTTSNYTLEDYKTCVPVVASTICYSTVIFQNNVEVDRRKRQELVLMPCMLETSNSTRLKINSTIGNIPPGIETVLHNARLYFFCGDPNCTLISNGPNQTRCANGTFQPDITSLLQDGCHCPGDLPIPLWSIILIGIGIVGLAGVVVGCSCCLCYCYRCYTTNVSRNIKESGQQTQPSDEDNFEERYHNLSESYVEVDLPEEDPPKKKVIETS